MELNNFECLVFFFQPVLSLVHFTWIIIITTTTATGEAEAEAVETTITTIAITAITAKTTTIRVTRIMATVAIRAAFPSLLVSAPPMRPSMTESCTPATPATTSNNTIQEAEEHSRPTIIEDEATEATVTMVTVVAALGSTANLSRKTSACNRKWTIRLYMKKASTRLIVSTYCRNTSAGNIVTVSCLGCVCVQYNQHVYIIDHWLPSRLGGKGAWFHYEKGQGCLGASQCK